MDSIFALSTAPGKAGVAIIRVSGPDAFQSAERICGSLPNLREARLRRLKDADGGHIDDAVLLTFPKDASFTGETVVEFHVHGSVSVTRALLFELSKQPNHRQAEPGEFTRRAMMNGRLDLTQVEALADLIEAETEAQRRQAQRMLDGALGDRVANWRRLIIRAAALLEATIDFADEEVPQDVTPEVRDLLSKVMDDVEQQIGGFAVSERMRQGFEVAIVGPPNAGKSSLLNYLAGRDAAITSEIAGTTRDVIEVKMDLDGLPVTFLDTAGLRETTDSIEALGIERAKNRAASADIRVYLSSDGRDQQEIALSKDDFVFQSKVDFGGVNNGLSSKSGYGIPEFLENLKERLTQKTATAGLANRERHLVAMSTGLGHLQTARVMIEDGPEGYDFASEEIRLAARVLEQLLGFVDVEHVLDEIFSSFCVGK